MQSEKPYTKLENANIFMALHREENEEYSQKSCLKSSILHQGIGSKGQSCKKLVSRKVHLKFSFHDT